MSTWLKLLPMELDSVHDIINPEEPVDKGEKIVGQMPESVKKLFTLGRLLEKDANQSLLDGRYCPDKERKLELEAKAAEYGAKSTVIKMLMWIGIRDEFGLWGSNVGIRNGFKVVVVPNTNDDAQSFFGHLFGGKQ